MKKIFILLLPLFIISCEEKSIEESVIGKWEIVGIEKEVSACCEELEKELNQKRTPNYHIFTIKSDGTFTISYEKAENEGIYFFIKDTLCIRFKSYIDGEYGDNITKNIVSQSKNKLYLTFEIGKSYNESLKESAIDNPSSFPYDCDLAQDVIYKYNLIKEYKKIK